MTAPRAREHAGPPSPPERLPPRRGGGPSPYIYAASAAGRPAGPARLCGARRGLARSARALAAAALLALSGTLALPATAQADVLVSNLGQAHDFDADLDDTSYLGQGFTVVAGGGNYTLTSIEIPFSQNGIAAADIASLSVSVWSTDSSGLPSASLHTLMNPASIAVDTTVTFNAQSGATLEAGKTYAVVVYYDKTLSQFHPAWSGTENAAESGATGWTIADSTLYLAASGTTWSSYSNEVYRIRVNGTTVGGGTPMLSTDATLSGGTVKAGSTTLVTFASGTTSYTASVANNVEEVTFAPTTNHGEATVRYLKGTDVLTDADSMDDGFQVGSLAVGANAITVEVTAEDGTTTQTYTVTVTRAAGPTCTLNTGDFWCGVVDVEAVTNSGGSTVGHGFSGTTGDIDGNPDDKDFTVPSNSNEYTISSLLVGAGNTSGSLILRLDKNLIDTATTDDKATLELVIDGETDSFPLSTAEPVNNGGYRWDGRGLDWSMESTVTVRLREEAPPTLSVADAAGDEDDDKVVFTVTLSKPYHAATSATWTASIGSGDTAVAADLGTTKTGTVAIAKRATTATFEVPVVDDTTDEDDETFTVTLSAPTPGDVVKLATDATAKGTINDDDDAAVTLPTLSVADAEGDEDDGVEFTATLTAGVSGKVTATWTASIESGDTASAADLATTKTGEVEFDENATTAMFTVPVNDDTTDEPDQTFTVTLSGVSENAQLAADPTAEGTIDDDDPAPTLTVADVRHDEGTVITNVTVSLSELSEKRVRFRLRQVDRTGDTASDADWTPRGGISFHAISAGTMSGSRWAVSMVRDTLDEDDETLTVEAYDLDNAQGSSSDKEATITIVDDDPTPTVTVADAAATEGDKVEFVVTLSAVSGRDVEVGYATSVATGDDATSGTDFTAATGTLTILAADGTDTGTVEVQTTEDDTSESAETFTLTLSATKNVELGTPSTATGTINNRATAAAAPTDFAAAVGNAQVTLTWDTPPTGVTKHQYQFKAGSAAYGGWQDIANSGVGGTTSYTETGLTNEVEYTFQLRAVNADGESTAVEADPVTPTPGICDRTDSVQEAIIYYLEDSHSLVRSCAEVTVADLAVLTYLEAGVQNIGSLKSGDFSGLTKVEALELNGNTFTTLPANLFSGMTALDTLKLESGALTSLPADVFTGLPALETLELQSNDLRSLDADVFDGLTALTTLWLHDNELTSLPAGVFDGLTALETIVLRANDLRSLDARQFSGLTALAALELESNDLTSLPRPGVHRPDGVGPPPSGRQRSDLAARRGVHRPDGADGIHSGRQPRQRRYAGAHGDAGEGGDRPGAGEGAGRGAVRGGLHADGGERRSPGQRHETRRGGGRRGGHGGHGDPHVRDDGGGDGGHRPVEPAVPAREPLGLRVREGGLGASEDDPAGHERAAEFHREARRRAGRAGVGRAGVGFRRDETPVPPEGGERELRQLD